MGYWSKLNIQEGCWILTHGTAAWLCSLRS
uniref:Uncharacterized protein n=1 Tax=Anguilla anguilla TaxID=7936 RepID=A0A0E9URA7_ANGAN